MAKVLIVEDQPAVAKALRMLFDLHEIDSATVANATAAERAVARGDIDVVVQDMNFTPGSTTGDEGIALFRQLRRLDPEMPVVLLTAWTSLENAVQLVKEGASDYVGKPWDDDKLLRTVRSLCDLRSLRAVPEPPRARRVTFEGYDLRDGIFESPAMQRVVALALQVAPSEASVLITGPNGSGKELIADIVQANSHRSRKPYVKVNTGGIPDTLLESELFGYEAGAFTGANRLRIGRFEAANGGTLFLDEIGNLSISGQAKLLRVLQSGGFERLGSSETRRADVRILCATNENLREAVARGRFREDLYFRLNVVEIAVPPLRARREDVEPLARAFAAGAARVNRMAVPAFAADAVAALVEHDWPGNVRELQNRVTRAVVMSDGREITAETLALEAEAAPPVSDSAERRSIEMAIRNADGSISRAAAALGISRQALYRRMERLGISLERRLKP